MYTLVHGIYCLFASLIGTSTGVRLYQREILDLICLSLSSQSWDVKRQAARALATLAETMGIRCHCCEVNCGFSLGSELVPPDLTVVLQSLLEGLQGRLWDGKDSLLTSLKTVCVSCASAIKKSVESQSNPKQVYQVIV